MDLSLEMDTDHIGGQLQALADERRTLPITANYGYHCKDCSFREICSTHLMGGDVEGVVQQLYRTRQAIAEQAESEPEPEA
jgi:hypothetical protein